MELNLGFLASHNGSNVKAILNNIKKGYLNAAPRIIITNNSNAGVLEVAKQHNIPSIHLSSKTHPDPFDLENAITKTLNFYQVNVVVLAGYMKKVSIRLIEAYPNRILNIHPALLPKYGGKGMYGDHVHEMVLKSDDTETGATVHIVNPEYDKGRILAQCKIPIYAKDNLRSLSQRVLRFEHVLYPQVLRDIEQGIICLDE